MITEEEEERAAEVAEAEAAEAIAFVNAMAKEAAEEAEGAAEAAAEAGAAVEAEAEEEGAGSGMDSAAWLQWEKIRRSELSALRAEIRRAQERLDEANAWSMEAAAVVSGKAPTDPAILRQLLTRGRHRHHNNNSSYNNSRHAAGTAATTTTTAIYRALCVTRGSESAVRLPSLPSVRDFGAKRIGWASDVEALLGAMAQGGVTHSIDELVRMSSSS